jgi:hypothetical protein
MSSIFHTVNTLVVDVVQKKKSEKKMREKSKKEHTKI